MLWRQIQSHWDYYRFVYAEETAFLWGSVAFLLGIVVLPEAWVTPAFIALAALGAAALVWRLVLIFRKWRSVRFAFRDEPSFLGERHGDPAAAVQWAASEPRLERTGQQPGVKAVEIWFDEAVDRALQAQSPAHRDEETGGNQVAVVRRSRHAYEMPAVLASGAAAALRVDRNTSRRRKLPIRFNGRLLRLTTEPTVSQLESGDFEVQPVTYFDGEASNETWPLVNTNGGEEAGECPVEEFVLDRAGRIRMLENARAANLVGISTVAVTADRHVVFVQQTHGNSIAPGSLAVSGSGSLEDIDLGSKGRRKVLFGSRHTVQPRRALTDLVLTGMHRELCEESLVRPEEIIADSAVVTGYFRWVDRAMKPEFSGLVRLDCTAEDLSARRQRGAERAFTQRTVAVPLDGALKRLSGSAESSGYIDYRAAGDAIDAVLAAEVTAGQLLTDHGGRVLMSPSAEHAWFAAARYLLSHPGWLGN
ncbi:hypothetical protein [Microbacterium sp. A93]|uniref:hypothetical protein n=1 Tax=Microbacterium sp. A93 TaxID=3450716 RepID=UPI003F41DC8A